MKTNRKFHSFKHKKGYTFVELIVVISIFSIIATVIVFNFSDFSTNISLQNTTADIALEIKEAQSDAISGRLTDAVAFTIGSGLEYFKPAYGIRFDLSSLGNNREFVKFSDLNKDRIYTKDNPNAGCNSSNPECFKSIFINGFDTITNLCVRTLGSSQCKEVEILDISFERPFPDAIIIADEDFLNNTDIIESAEITITSSKQKKRTVVVSSIGSISVYQSN